jgi:hypothetical protein
MPVTKKERRVFKAVTKDGKLTEAGRREVFAIINDVEKRIDTLVNKHIGALKADMTQSQINAAFGKMNSEVSVLTKDAENRIVDSLRATYKEHLALYQVKLRADRLLKIEKLIERQTLGLLSKAMRTSNLDTLSRFKHTLALGLSKGNSAVKIAKTLSKVGDIVASGISVPKHIREIENALRTAISALNSGNNTLLLEQRVALNRILQKHSKYIDNLTRAGAEGFQQLGIRGTTRQFAKQAQSMINDVSKLNTKNVDNMVKVWTDKKINYHQKVVARTEASRMYNQNTYNLGQELDFVTHYDVLLSESHPEPDICDDLQGRYPKEGTVPQPPHHPNCLCRMELVTEREIREEAGLGEQPSFKKNIHKEAEEFE